jgi:hypothetical protein
MFRKRSVNIAIILLILVVMFGACTRKYDLTLGKSFTLESGTIVKGKTSKEEIISKLGTPSMVLNPQGGGETVVYAYNSGDKQEFELGLLVIMLTEKGIVSDYYCNIQSSSAKDKKQETSGLPLTKDSIDLIKQLLESGEPYKKASAITLALGKFDPAELGFIQEYVKAHIEGETDPEVMLSYLVAMQTLSGNESYLDKMIELLENKPSLLSDVRDDNLMLYSLVVDSLASAGGNPKALGFIYAHAGTEPYKAAFSSKLHDIFSSNFNPSLSELGKLDSRVLSDVIPLLGIEKDMDDINYLRLEYYILSGSKEYSSISKKILELTKSK